MSCHAVNLLGYRCYCVVPGAMWRSPARLVRPPSSRVILSCCSPARTALHGVRRSREPGWRGPLTWPGQNSQLTVLLYTRHRRRTRPPSAETAAATAGPTQGTRGNTPVLVTYPRLPAPLSVAMATLASLLQYSWIITMTAATTTTQ